MSSSKQKTTPRDAVERQLVALRKNLGVKTLDEVKRREIARVHVLAKGDTIMTAVLLGISKNTVYRSLHNK